MKYTEHDVSRDRAAGEEMVKATGQMGVPVIMVDGQAVIGFDRARIQALVTAGEGRRPRFGLKIADAVGMAPKRGRAQVAGAYIGEVAAGSAGDRAGLKPGDVVTRINSDDVAAAADAERVLGRVRTGDIVSFVFERDGDTRKSEIVV
ncbi:MAG: hypothetical protein A2Z29_05695 [Chloroflexi bacterium RBG_16_56_11]|nr:MAG: hypothetical protein A2Z29_05695 [Chloroflexi bacterium RBG_16_56_11]